MTVRFGIDLGGTKTEIIALAPDGRTLHRNRTKTPRDDYRATVAQVRDLVEASEENLNERGTVGIGIPGTVDPVQGIVKNANSTWLNGRAFDQDLQLALNRPVRVENDANCFALSEAMDGAGKDYRTVFGVIIGTGCGAGIVVEGHLLKGPNHLSGEWGHNPLPWASEEEACGPECYCGKTGCIETWVSGPGLENDFHKVTGTRKTAVEIAQTLDSGTPEDLTLRRYENRLARALASIANVLDPDVIVLGGGMSNVTRLYENLPSQIGQWIFGSPYTPNIVPNRHGDSSGVRGAAWLWPLNSGDS